MAEAKVLLAKKSAISNCKIQAAMDRKRKAEIVSQAAPDTCGATVQQSRSQAQPANKKQKLANLSSFLSPSDAIYHDLQVLLDTDQVDVKLTIETMLSRVDGSDSKAMWKVLPHAVVRYFSTKQENVLEELFAACQKKGIIKTTFISQAESNLLDFLSEFIKLCEDTDKNGLMGVVWTAIFNKDLTSQPAKQSLCRLFTSLCKTQGDIEQVRVLLYNIAWCGYLDTPTLLLAVVGVWPDVMSTTAQHKKSSVLFVFEYLLDGEYKDDSETYQKVSHVLQRICHWDIYKKKFSPEELLKLLHKHLNELLKGSSKRKDDVSFEFIKAMELLMVYQGAAWTEEHFFKRMLVSVASKWLHRGGEENGPTPQLVVCLFRLFRSVVAIHPLTSNGLAVVLSQVFAKFITRNSGLMNVETSYIDTLLEITPQNPEKCLELLKKWKDNNKGKMLNQTFSKLLQIQTLLSKHGTT